MDSFGLGPVPSNEECAQVGTENYMRRAKIECKTFVSQLERVFPDPPPGVYFRVTHNPHDFGTYLDVEVRFNDDDSEATAFAIKVENETPANWDEIAKKELMVLMLELDTLNSKKPVVNECDKNCPGWSACQIDEYRVCSHPVQTEKEKK